jgi:hypothetical protein
MYIYVKLAYNILDPLALDMDGRFLNNGTLRRDSFDFGECILNEERVEGI